MIDHLVLLSGHRVGIIANQTPILFTKESQKAVQFIRLYNVTGFMVGKKTEREGLVKSGSLFVDAVSRSQVPHLSVICGASYGAGNYAVSLRVNG
jgi:acetyl-CoA carboxylase carboxyltransferase component